MSDEGKQRSGRGQDAGRGMALAIRLMAYVAVLLVPVILFCRYQYIPFDDCLRHAAKAVSGKAWADVLVLREVATVDQHPGWHYFLTVLHSAAGLGKAELVVVAWVLLFVLVAAVVLPLFRRPEAWIAALLVACLAFPESYVFRLTRGRPYLFTESVLLVLLAVWGRSGPKSARLLGVTTVLIGLAIWLHGTTWYMWGLVVAAFVFAGLWQDAFLFGVCAVCGALAGATLTGHPVAYLVQQVELPFYTFGDRPLARMLVGEFQPCSGGLSYLLALGLACVARHAAGGGWVKDSRERFLLTLAVVGWLGGLHISRLWTEWGLPASQLWLAFVLQDLFCAAVPSAAGSRRFWLAALLCVAFVLSASGDLEGRWSQTFRPARLGTCVNVHARPDQNKRVEDGWLPGPGGIVYNSQMDVFNLLFFERPEAPWRYVYGYESGLMRADDLQTLRNIQFNRGEWPAYAPWVAKMRDQDRLIVKAAVRPGIQELEWREYGNGFWIGRIPAGARK